MPWRRGKMWTGLSIISVAWVSFIWKYKRVIKWCPSTFVAFFFCGVHVCSLPYCSSVQKWSETLAVSEFLTEQSPGQPLVLAVLCGAALVPGEPSEGLPQWWSGAKQCLEMLSSQLSWCFLLHIPGCGGHVELFSCPRALFCACCFGPDEDYSLDHGCSPSPTFQDHYCTSTDHGGPVLLVEQSVGWRNSVSHPLFCRFSVELPGLSFQGGSVLRAFSAEAVTSLITEMSTSRKQSVPPGFGGFIS